MAFSGSNSNNSLYTDELDLNDKLAPSTIYAELTTQFVNQLFKSAGDNRVLPIGTAINVNYPQVGYLSKNEACISPKWTQTRATGQYASTPDLKYNETSKIFDFVNNEYEALTVCQNGDCSLPSENEVVEHLDCQTSYSVVSIDYDANAELTAEVANLLAPLNN